MTHQPPKTQEASAKHSPADLPPELDPDHYRRANPDLAGLTGDQLKSHFDLYGRDEGRAGSPHSFREHFLTLLSQTADTLEIGPFCLPQVRGERVRYFDIADREELIRRALEIQYPVSDPPAIDYVSPTGDMEIVRDHFDQVFSSHCVEHQPDLVGHFSQVSRILRAGGAYFLIVPDKRYCFDHFLAETTLADVLGAHVEQRRLHSAKSVLEHRLLTTHNDPLRHWRGDHGAPVVYSKNINDIKADVDFVVKSAGTYADTHAWQFTPQSFQGLSEQLLRLGLTDLNVARIYNTPFGRFEFCAILSRR